MRRFTQRLTWPLRPRAGGVAVTAPPRERKRRGVWDIVFDGLCAVTAWLWMAEHRAHKRIDYWLDNGGVFSPAGQQAANWFSAVCVVALIAAIAYVVVRGR